MRPLALVLALLASCAAPDPSLDPTGTYEGTYSTDRGVVLDGFALVAQTADGLVLTRPSSSPCLFPFRLDLVTAEASVYSALPYECTTAGIPETSTFLGGDVEVRADGTISATLFVRLQGADYRVDFEGIREGIAP